MARNEPSYLAFARENVRVKATSSPIIVRCLLDRIDDLERQIELRESD